ncbi:MAG: hypothetical protein KDI18_16240, partial [Gammaproteobacteria bacterium]|nr:hypothetical protein [Gammaproteobacteria bacterium]
GFDSCCCNFDFVAELSDGALRFPIRGDLNLIFEIPEVAGLRQAGVRYRITCGEENFNSLISLN